MNKEEKNNFTKEILGRSCKIIDTGSTQIGWIVGIIDIDKEEGWEDWVIFVAPTHSYSDEYDTKQYSCQDLGYIEDVKEFYDGQNKDVVVQLDPICRIPIEDALKIAKEEQEAHKNQKVLWYDEINKRKDNKIMSKASNVVNKVKNTTIESAKTAAKLELVGRTGLNIAREQIKNILPVPPEYLENPASDIVISMLVTTILAILSEDNKYANVAAEAMSTVAMQNSIAKLQLPDLANKLVDGIGVNNIKSIMEKDKR